jgi:hypothetical protein
VTSQAAGVPWPRFAVGWTRACPRTSRKRLLRTTSRSAGRGCCSPRQIRQSAAPSATARLAARCGRNAQVAGPSLLAGGLHDVRSERSRLVPSERHQSQEVWPMSVARPHTLRTGQPCATPCSAELELSPRLRARKHQEPSRTLRKRYKCLQMMGFRGPERGCSGKPLQTPFFAGPHTNRIRARLETAHAEGAS